MPEVSGNNSSTMADQLLLEMRDSQHAVAVYLVNGFQLKGEILQFDHEAILFKLKGAHQLVMRSAVATMYPLPATNDTSDAWWQALASEPS